MTLYERLQASEYKYSPTIVRDMIASNREKYGRVKPKTKEIIFLMMKRVVLRGAITFMNIQKNRNNDTCYEMEDIIMELYMTFSRACDLFNTESDKDFMLYFNSAVSRRVSRMSNYKHIRNDEMSFTYYENQYDDDEISDVLENDMGQMDFNSDMFWEDLGKIGLSEDQMDLVWSVFTIPKKREILHKHGLNRKQFAEQIEGITKLIKTNYYGERSDSRSRSDDEGVGNDNNPSPQWKQCEILFREFLETT